MAGQRILTYALLSAFSQEGGDYLDAFWPFVLRAFPASGRVSCHALRDTLAARNDLPAPIHVIHLIVERAFGQGLVTRGSRRGTYELLDAGREQQEGLETDRDVERRLGSLLEDAKEFFGASGVALSAAEIRELLLAFVDEHNTEMVALLNAEPAPAAERTASHPRHIERLFIQYMRQVEATSPDHYRTLQDVLMGSIIQCALALNGPLGASDPADTALRGTRVFLDTNFLIGLLDLSFSETSAPARELHQLLLGEEVSVRVFGFTVEELRRLLVEYIHYRSAYLPAVRVNDLFSSLRVKGWTDVRAREYIARLEETIQGLGIVIEPTPQIRLDSYAPLDGEVAAVVAQYKPEQSATGRAHDVAAIEMIRGIRTTVPAKLAAAEAIFLSSDGRLSRASYAGLHHKASGTIAEVIQDRLLTSILWLRSPSSKPTLSTVIASLSRNLFVKRRVWQRFVAILAESARSGTGVIDVGVVSTLLYHGNLELALEELTEADAEELDEPRVLRLIDEATKESAEAAKLTEKQQEEQQAALSEAIADNAQKVEAARDEALAVPRQRLRRRCDRIARGLTFAASAIAELAVAAGLCGVWYWLVSMKLQDLCVVAITVFLGLSALGGLPVLLRRVRKRLRVGLSDWCYRRRASALGLSAEDPASDNELP